MRRNTTWETNDLLSDSEQLHKLTRLRLKWTTFHSSSQTVYEDDFQSPGISGWHPQHPQDIDSDLFPPTRWLLTCASPTASFIACTPTVQSAIESIPCPWPKLYTLKGWRYMEMKWYDKHQTWSNLIKLDQTWHVETCSSVKHVFTLSVFHSYFIHITYISSNFSSNLLFSKATAFRRFALGGASTVRAAQNDQLLKRIGSAIIISRHWTSGDVAVWPLDLQNRDWIQIKNLISTNFIKFPAFQMSFHTMF